LHFHIRGCHPLWPAFPDRSINAPLSLFLTICHNVRAPLREPDALTNDYCGPATPDSPFGIIRFRLFRVRSPLLAESLLFSLPLGTEMVHFPRFASAGYVFTGRSWMFPSKGFPHSDIPGSQIACISPRLIAAGHVLHRLPTPRHPHACS
jgi:hypothetical protein